ncbi:A24 family peptidase [Vibrio sp. Sgm 22]|uniref:A24 family peptidase n=1 Tax=unclassified Vibrio TaxID=2614977 RepID=UPI002248C465|nr:MULTISPECIES: A24 family peptidase [unclassified Vibrio]MCX2756983.1 A24 family peptidase [Vibrio sp. 14G-20]MCX2773944.1 A24 family peptidase [Vibrio sp. Sgm 22]
MINEPSAFWALLIAVSVYDVEKHRIPNKILTLLLFVYFLSMFDSNYTLDFFLSSLAGFVVLFGFGLLLYFMRAMSAGDVKLLGVVGLYLGWGQILDASYFILLASGMIGTFYLLYNYANSSSVSVKGYFQNKLILLGGVSPVENKDDSFHNRYLNKVTMPFAPSVVIGLAMYSYFN